MKTIAPAETDENLTAISRVTIVGAFLNLALTALKTGVGVLGGSTALVADGLHSLSDLTTDAIVFVGARIWTRPADESHPNGHAKIESLATLFVALALIRGTWRNCSAAVFPPCVARVCPAYPPFLSIGLPAPLAAILPMRSSLPKWSCARRR